MKRLIKNIRLALDYFLKELFKNGCQGFIGQFIFLGGLLKEGL